MCRLCERFVSGPITTGVLANYPNNIPSFIHRKCAQLSRLITVLTFVRNRRNDAEKRQLYEIEPVSLRVMALVNSYTTKT